MSDAFRVVRDFEEALAAYCGSRFAVTTTSCTMALLLACAWHRHKTGAQTVSVPKRTYVGVPMSVVHAGHRVAFREEGWSGKYRLDPLPVWDAARWLTSGVHVKDEMTCLSFHTAKHLGLTAHGGAICCDDPDAASWMRRARFDGRREGVHPKDDVFEIMGWHCYMTPATAAEGLTRLMLLPEHNDPLPNDDYSDLSQAPVFRGGS